MACEVCSLPDDGLHFRRKTCRACSAFWRRSIVRRSVYKCKGDNNCVLSKELRKTCAACRLKKCHEIGMCESDVQWCRDRNGPLKIKRASSSTVSLPSTPQNERARTTSFTSGYSSGETSTSLCSSPTAYYFQPAMYTVGSTLAQLQSYIQDFLRLSRAVYSMIYPERNHIDTLEFYEANHSEMVNFDRALLSLVQSMLFKINPSLEQLSTEFKSRLLRSFTSLFFPLYKSYLTLLVFPQLDDTRFVCNMGQYSNCNVNFFSADQDPNKMSNDIRLKCQQTTRKIKQLGIREIEFGALCGIICANEDLRPIRMPCEVCGLSNNGSHFGAKSCRACASFYRRSIVKNLVYTCKNDKKCKMQKGIRFHSDLNGTLKSSCRSDLELTNKLETCVERQEDRFVETPTSMESTSSPQVYQCRKITHAELIEFEKGCMPLVLTLLTKWCPIFNDLPVKLQCFLTATWTSATPIGGFILHYGLYVDVFDQFFTSDDYPQESRKCVERMRLLGIRTAEKMRKIKIREIEFGALAGVILANEIDSTFKCAVMSIFRDRIFQDLHTNIASVYGEHEVGIRMAALICLIQDLDVCFPNSFFGFDLDLPHPYGGTFVYKAMLAKDSMQNRSIGAMFGKQNVKNEAVGFKAYCPNYYQMHKYVDPTTGIRPCEEGMYSNWEFYEEKGKPRVWFTL
ncbi:CBN-NHR-71 protein [Aphelenchoides besseyi]|nr:CBN-NHR-71 protein [Aphelenchoides besseyi]